jgi:exodeoxyribonuclease VII small subunit
MKKDISYKEAQQELQQILQQLQEGQIDIDELSQQVSRAAELIHYCREKLRTAEEQIGGLFEDSAQ